MGDDDGDEDDDGCSEDIDAENEQIYWADPLKKRKENKIS